MKYSNIISDMVWSYSRLTTFEDCPYRFYLNYILHQPKEPRFFSDYGTLMHKILELYLKGEMKREDMLPYYLTRFSTQIRGAAPHIEMYRKYLNQGVQYLTDFSFPYTPVAVEKQLDFTINGKPFTGVIDCVARDGDQLVIVDHKSRLLHNRSGKQRPTKSDEELDKYLRQLYLYSIPVKEEFGRYPDRLEFNCFRSGELVSEPFRMERLEYARTWASKLIDTIIENDVWNPSIEQWKCTYICDLCANCEYYQTNFGAKKR